MSTLTAERLTLAYDKRVVVDGLDLVVQTPGLPQVTQRLGVNRKKAHRRAVFGGHVGDGGTVGERHGGEPGTVELDELTHDTLLPEHLRDDKC